MPREKSFRVTRTAIDNLVWTPIVAPPFKGQKLAVYSEGGVEMLLRVDAADADTQKTLPANSQEDLDAPGCFDGNETVFYAKSTAASDVVIATWVAEMRN